MSAATHDRRTALRFGLAATIAGLTTPVVAAIAAPGADAELLRLCAEYQSAKDELDVLDAAPGYPHGSAENDAEEAAFARAVARIDKVVTSVSRLTANTPAGLTAKASIIEQELPYRIGVFELSMDSPEIELVMSLMRDITGGAA